MYIRKRPLRLIATFGFLLACLFYFSVKLTLIQVFRSAYLAKLAAGQHSDKVDLEPKRGTIFDRNGKPLALNVPAYSLYGQPRLMERSDKSKAVQALPSIISINPDFVERRLDRDKDFVWLKRKISPQLAKKIESLHIKGLGFIKESKRYYPNDFLAAHLIGFAGIDNQGLEGLELQYDKQLRGRSGSLQIIKDARQRPLLIEKDFVAAKDGFDLVLTIDETIQFLAERALEEAFQKHNAIGASIIVMNPKTGAILAMANRPTYNLSDFTRSTADSRRNRAISDMYEPGSVFKIVTAAAALEEGKFTENDTFFCENGTYKVGPHILHDHRPHGTLTFSEVFEQSSNIGVTKIAQALGPDIIYKYAKLFRFGRPTGIKLAGEVGGVLKPPSQWSKVSIAAIPIGHEVTANALQIVSAMAAIANDGVYMKPFVVKYIKDKHGEIIHENFPKEVSRVISASTARRLKAILQRVVEKGTGRYAAIKGVNVAGKTGTAQKVIDGQYSHSKFFASFVGFAPVEDPKIAMVVVFDEPHPGHYGGTVSAPVFKKVAEDVLKYLATQEEETAEETGL